MPGAVNLNFMSVPITPGNPEPEPQPVYMAPPPQYAPTPADQTVKKAAVGTVTVIAVLVGLFCVLPMIACGVFAALGSMSSQQ